MQGGWAQTSLLGKPRIGAILVPLYTARVSDLKAGDSVLVECGACGHDGLIHPAALPSLGLGRDERVVDLASRLRCREYGAKGEAVVSIRWGDDAV